MNSATCSSNNSEYDKYESNTSSEYNLSEYMYTNRCSGTSTQSNTSTSTQSNTSASSDEDNKEELSSSSIFVSGYDKVNFPDIPPPSRQNESTGSSHLHYNETQPGSKTKKKTKPLYKEKSNNKHKRDVLILPNITLKENEPIKTSIINNNKPNANKRKNMSEKIDKREGKQIYGVKQSDLSLLDDSSDDEAVRQYYERQKSKHRPGGARRRCRERENTFYESNEAMCYDVSSNARRHEAEPVSLPALDNLGKFFYKMSVK